MFEQSKPPASPEPRGRSPADNVAIADGPVRPTSKVRASFVSVEPGKLIPADPGVPVANTDAARSSTTHRRESFSVSEDTKEDVTAELKKVVSQSQETPKDGEAIPDVLSDVVPEQAIETRESSRDPPPIHEEKAEGTMPNLGSIMKGSDFPEPAPAKETHPVEEPKVDPAVEPAIEPEAVSEEAPVAEEPKEEPEEVHEDLHEEEQEEISELEPEEISELPEEISELEPEDVPEVVHEEEPLNKEVQTNPEENLEEAPKEGAKEESKDVEDKSTTSAQVDAPSDNPDKIVMGVQEDASLKPADPKDEAAVSGGEALPPPTEDLRAAEPSPTVAEPSPVASELSVATAKAAGMPLEPKVDETPVANSNIATKKPPTISTTKAPGTSASSSKSPLPKSPGFARLPKTPTTPRAASLASKARSPAPMSRSPAPAKELPKATAPKTVAPKPVAPKTVASKATAAPKTTPALKDPIRAPVAKTSRSSLRPAAATTTPPKPKAPIAENKKAISRSSTAAHAPGPKESTATTSVGGFKKPKPKSPTRPVRLPSHLTAPTAASAAKHGDEAAAQKVVRKPSTATRPAPKTTVPARKIPSRSSLAPSTAPGKRPESRASTKGGAEEGFLARMMRPTNASASKTHEKPVSPPRRGASVRGASKTKAHESVVAKGKRKVGEVATKAKDAVTNGHGSDNPSEEHHTVDHHNEDHQIEDQHTEAGAVEPTTSQETPAREATPEQGTESSAIELQTPNFEGQAIR